MKPSSRRSGESSSARSGGTIVTWLHMHEEVRDALGLRALERQRGRRRRRLEADREEDDLAVGVLPWRSAARRAASRPSARRRPAALASSSVPSRARDAHHVAEAGEDHAGLVGDRDPVVDAAHRDHADRAAGAVDELDVRRQQVVDPVLVDRVRVAAADLHHLVVAARLDGRRGSRPRARGRARRRGTRRRTSRGARAERRRRRGRAARRPSRPARRARSRPCARSPSSASHSASPRSSSTRSTRIGTRLVAARDAVHRAASQALTRSRSPCSSSSSCSYSAPISSSSRRVASASSSSICEIAKPTWISTQSPARLDVGVEQADVDGAAHARDLDPREPVPSSTISTIWPGMARHTVSPSVQRRTLSLVHQKAQDADRRGGVRPRTGARAS